MKKVIIIMCVLIFVLLLIPFRAQYKDGGSIHYDAILYDVYVVHSIYDAGPDTEMKFVEGVIIEIFGIQVFNNTNPHIENFGDQPYIKYKMPVECVEIYGERVVELTSKEQGIIVDIINAGDWTDDVIKCECDYKFSFVDCELSYHSECGHFVDYEGGRTLTISRENIDKINAILFGE